MSMTQMGATILSDRLAGRKVLETVGKSPPSRDPFGQCPLNGLHSCVVLGHLWSHDSVYKPASVFSSSDFCWHQRLQERGSFILVCRGLMDPFLREPSRQHTLAELALPNIVVLGGVLSSLRAHSHTGLIQECLFASHCPCSWTVSFELHSRLEVPNTCIGGSGAGTPPLGSWTLASLVPVDFPFGFCCFRPSPYFEGSPTLHARGAPFVMCTLSLHSFCSSGRRDTLLLFPWKDVPNTCIGGAGAGTSSLDFPLSAVHLPFTQRVEGSYSCVMDWLLSLGHTFHNLAHSMALSVLLLLLALWIRPFHAKPTPLGFLLGAYTHGAPVHALCALGVTSPQHCALNWQPWRDRKGKVPRSSPRGIGPLARLSLGLLGILALPEQVHAGPDFRPVWILASPAFAMTRPPRPEDPPGLPYSQRRPHMIPPEELTTHVGTCSHTFVSGLRRDADGEEPHLLPLDSSLLQPPQDVQEQGSEWLGVYLLAPHYKTISLAINPPERTMRSALDLLLSRAPDVPGTFFDSVVPLRPQRFQGVGSFVRFSSSVRNVGVGGQAVVALDLTRVGGHYFAAVLARELEFRTLMDYIVPLTSCGDEPLSVYIGYRTRPWPACAMVQLSDGEVITVLKEQYAASRPLKAEDLFNASTRWLFPRDVPELTYCEALYVLHQERRYLLPEHHHYGSTSVSFVADKLHLDPYKTVMCTFPIDDLDVQGTLARALVAVAEVPTPANTGVTREDAKDLFVLLDPRPFGLKPHFLFLHHEVVHLPTVIALLGLPTSRAHKVGVAGGEVQGNQIIVDGSSTLLLFPAARTEEELAEAASSSSDVSRLVSPWEEEEEAPQDDLQDADWGPPAGLTFAGVPVVDPSLPPGQSWNEGIDINVGDHLGVTAGDSGEPDPGTPVTSGRATTDTQPLQDPVGPLEDASPPSVSGLVELLQIQALVYVPDFVPEIVELELTIPATVPSLLACLQDARLAYQSSSFPDLFPAKPQIVPAFAIFVAAPLWQRGTSVVLFDCLMYDGTFFAKTVQRRLNRESLMLAAGLPHDAAVHVYVRGAVNHLGLGERLTIDNGDVIQIVRRGCAPGACHELSDRLCTADLWDRQANIPGPRSHFNGYFLILNEGRPFPFQVAADRRATFKQDVAASLGSEEHRLSLKSTVPRVVDAYPFGYWASGIIVATEALSRVPYPPARQHEFRRILVLDQRRILQGFSWRLVPTGTVSVQSLVSLYADTCPYRHTVLIHGAPVEQHDDETVFVIQHGQVLTVEYRPVAEGGDVPAAPWSDHTQHIPGTSQGSLPDGDRSRPPDGHRSSGDTGNPDRNRSRTPRQHGPRPVADAEAPVLDICSSQHCRHKWSLDLKHHAHHVGNLSLTPDPWHCLGCLQAGPLPNLRPSFDTWDASLCCDGFVKDLRVPTSVSLWSTWRSIGFHGTAPLSRGFKLLTEPVAGRLETQDLLAGARTATRWLGGAWPFPPYRWPIELPPEEEDDSQSDHMATGVSVEVTFYLLTPGYTPEKLELTVVLPQVVADVLDLVETCRDAARKVLYPSLIVVHPQPDPGWGILLALPTWVAHQTVICVDASLYDGRIFAIDASGATDFEALCELVGLAPTAEVDIFLPNSQQPLGRAEECMLRTGMCISLLRRGSARIGPFHLPAMLNSHLSWEHSPMFPRDTLGNGYCVAGPQGQILYRLHPERAFYYRSDIALLVGLHPFRTVVTPASPQPSDVCVRGWECRAVVAATDRDDQITWDGDVHPATVGLLDCRPLLLGWLPVSSREHWLELGPLRDALARHAPHGWQVVFPAFPAHWTWTCFAPGQVITVAYAPIARAALNTIRTGGFAHLDDDDDMPTDDQVSESEDTSWPGATGQVSDHTVDHAPGHLHGLSRVNWFWRTVHLFAACCALSLMPHVPEPALVPGAFALCVLATPGATAPQRPHWWRALKERFDRFCHGSIPFILGDFNMHFAEDVPGHVGDKVFPSRHEVPEAFLELIRQYELWIPSTFSQCHPGDHATWFPPTGGPGSRLDYVLISKEWHVGANESQVFSALDWGQPRVDHLALRTYVHFRSTGSVETRAHRPMYDREAMLTLEGKSRLEEIFSAVPAQPWATNVHEHYAGVQRYLVGALELAFPTAKKCCRSSHFSASTWQLRQRRVWLRRQVTRLGKISQIVDQKCAFLCLRLRLRIQVGSWVYALRHGRVIHTLASYVAELRDTKKTLRQSIRHDVGTRIQSAATSAESTSTGNVVSRLQCLLGPSARKTRPPRRLPSLTRADGSPALEPLEVEEAWVEHFSGIEDGCRRSPEDLVAACLHTQRSRDLDDMDIGPMDLPTQADLETAFRDTTLHRAYGIDGVPVEALHSAPGAAARAMFPVILKCALRLEEPLHFKGGSLYAVWKGKSSPGLCSSYRGILVSSTIGKAYHRLIRTRNIPALKEASTPLQIGGLPKCPVTLAAQVVRLHQNWCRKAGISQATLFLDLREAFYRIVRPLVTGFRGTDEDIARIVSSVHLPPGVMHELRAHLEDKSLLEQSGATQWAATAACEALHHTWFRFEHGKTVTETNIGTRPGDNLADLVFSFVFARVLHQVREVAEAQASLSVLPWHSDMLNNVLDDLPAATETVPLLDCTWMDDSAFVVCHADASTLVGNLRLISGALLDSCLGRAMLPNLDRGKTEAVLSLVGRGSRKLRADLFRRDPPVLEAPCQLWPGANVRLVSQYKHLGGLIHHTGSLLREVKCRVALAWGAFNRRRKRIFASPVVDRGDKVQLFDSLVISVLLHGAGTWTEVGTDELRHLSAAYHHMVATMLRPQYRLEEAKHLGSSQILSLARLPSVEVLLHLARLRHLQSCVVVGAREFWALAHAEGSWLSLVRGSLQWLHETTHGPKDPAHWRDAWPQWRELMCARPGSWKRLLRKAQHRATRQERWHAARLQHRGLLSRQLQLAGGLLICDPPPSWNTAQCCAPCAKTFQTKQQWSVHAFKCHGRVAVGRGVLSGHQCQHCLRQFGTNLKLCKHLAYSTTCRHSLRTAGFRCRLEPGQGSRAAEDAGASQAPVLQALGPTLAPCNASWVDAEDRPVAEILDCLLCIGRDGTEVTRQALWQQVKIAFSCVCAETGRLRHTADTFLSLLPGLQDLLDSVRSDLGDVISWVMQADVVEWLVPAPDCAPPVGNTFQDCESVLGMMEVAHLLFPASPCSTPDCIRLLVGPESWCRIQEATFPNSVTFTLDECISLSSTGTTPSFFEGPYDGVVCHLCVDTWNGFGDPPPPHVPAKAFEAHLVREVLCGDIARLALRLWGLGVPTCLLFPAHVSSAISPIHEVGALEQGTAHDLCLLRNKWPYW